MPKAMVVDDSRAIRMILSRTLGSLGFEVCQASNGQEALERLASFSDGESAVEVVLVDWNMPVMNGLEFVRNVRSIREYDETRLMMVTTETQIEQMTKALEAGANEYVMKPFTEEVISDKLRLMGVVE